MADSESSKPSERGRGRGRGSRGGLGKYLRARGRGHRGGGRPAVFSKRLLLEGEEAAVDGEEDEEAAAERAAKYSRRQLGTNADRYAEPEPELDSEGEAIMEPEVDLSTFLKKQRISEPEVVLGSEQKAVDESDVDVSLAHISSAQPRGVINRKGNVQEIKWGKELEEMSKDKAAAEAQRGAYCESSGLPYLKARFKAKAEKLKTKPVFKSTRERQADLYEEAPELPSADGSTPKPTNPKADMEEFLDDLLG